MDHAPIFVNFALFVVNTSPTSHPRSSKSQILRACTQPTRQWAKQEAVRQVAEAGVPVPMSLPANDLLSITSIDRRARPNARVIGAEKSLASPIFSCVPLLRPV
jgi:hypothetical protein